MIRSESSVSGSRLAPDATNMWEIPCSPSSDAALAARRRFLEKWPIVSLLRSAAAVLAAEGITARAERPPRPVPEGFDAAVQALFVQIEMSKNQAELHWTAFRTSHCPPVVLRASCVSPDSIHPINRNCDPLLVTYQGRCERCAARSSGLLIFGIAILAIQPGWSEDVQTFRDVPIFRRTASTRCR